MHVKTAYNFDPNENSVNTGLECKDESRTKQSFKEDADLNVMIRKFGVETVAEPNWAELDVSNIPGDYHKVRNQLIEADELFQSIPSHIRASVDNDMGKFLALVEREQREHDKRQKDLEKARKAASLNEAPEAKADTPTE